MVLIVAAMCLGVMLAAGISLMYYAARAFVWHITEMVEPAPTYKYRQLQGASHDTSAAVPTCEIDEGMQ